MLLFRLEFYFFNNFLLLNPDKTKLVVFGSLQLLAKLPDFKISLLGKDLASAKDLGVVLDSQLTFDDHVLKITSLVCQASRKSVGLSMFLTVTNW